MIDNGTFVLRRLALAALVVALLVPGLAVAQSLQDAVERARTAWLAPAARDLVSRSDTVRLRIPGVAVSEAVRPGQAARLLAKYLEGAAQAEFELREIRHVGAGHAYAEMAWSYVVRGTRDRREETVFFGFRVIDGEWRLREVRVTS